MKTSKFFETVRPLIGIGVAALIICLVYGALFTAIIIAVWFQKTGGIFIRYPSINFYDYIGIMRLGYFFTAALIGAAGLYLLYGRKRIVRLAM